ncbi:hypothetical protein CD798_18015 [Bacillaceae bacterium SAOS 7]|nr:hypothetical protein CD798_18015 [Bacillaceae bacterium SAOS 7]
MIKLSGSAAFIQFYPPLILKIALIEYIFCTDQSIKLYYIKINKLNKMIEAIKNNIEREETKITKKWLRILHIQDPDNKDE